MRFFFFILISIFSGIFAGMGMGGGTFLIPLLSIIFNIDQVICQSTNVLCFIVLAIICVVIYFKNKLINIKALICIAIPASIIASIGSIFALKINSNLLSILFACFVIGIGIFYLIMTIISMKKKKS